MYDSIHDTKNNRRPHGDGNTGRGLEHPDARAVQDTAIRQDAAWHTAGHGSRETMEEHPGCPDSAELLVLPEDRASCSAGSNILLNKNQTGYGKDPDIAEPGSISQPEDRDEAMDRLSETLERFRAEGFYGTTPGASDLLSYDMQHDAYKLNSNNRKRNLPFSPLDWI